MKEFPWSSVGIMVDVGGAFGATSSLIARNYPSIKCIVQDLPSIVDQARSQVPEDVAGQLEFMAHDIFKEQTVKHADLYLFRMILHDWSDIKAHSILRSLVPALKSGSHILLQDFVVPPPGCLPNYHEKTIRYESPHKRC